MKKVRHVVLVKLNGTQPQIDMMHKKLKKLKSVIPEIRKFKAGQDARVTPSGNSDYAIVAEFASKEDYLTYATHPDHVAVINNYIKPILVERRAVQYEF